MLELKKFWQGVVIHCSSGTVRIRAALTCVTCDIPASRKVNGFVSHAAKKGCSKCYKVFESSNFGSKLNYGGDDMETW